MSNMALAITIVFVLVAFGIGVAVGPYLHKTQDQKNMEFRWNELHERNLSKSGITKLWKPEGWEHDYFSYDLRSWDGGKTWYALEMEAPNSTGLKDDKVIILGQVKDVYPGFMEHELAWDKLTKHVKDNGPIDNIEDANRLFEGTGITVSVDTISHE